ncbi:MAG: site-specific integrase [Nocardioides sp.]|uniref:tyrosine-type recombinase/integrase n=1 Tax=Nocardioides sp. TaxID=35761 RepID=UPI00238EEFE2|nr:site-specific integrase [Nocardioides sp.]MDE0777161.1 site-specific integrase [Nocardioides sp.]
MAEGITRRGQSWRARYRNPETGRQHEQSFARQVDAIRWRREQLESLDRGRWIDPRAGTVTFLRYFEAWEVDQVWTEGTRKAMSLAARSTTFGDVPLAKIRPSHLEAWVKSMTVPTERREHGLAPGTIKTRFVNVRSVFRAALRDGMLAKDPTEKIRLPRQRKREASMEIPAPEQLRRILNASEPRFRAFVSVCAFAGLRLGEAAALQVGDVDFLRRTLHVRRQVQRAGGGSVEIRLPKYGSERSIPIPDHLVQVLAEHVALGLVGEWLFADAEDVPPHQNTVGYRWRATLKRAGLADVRLHDLRHFYASGLIAAGCDVVTVQRNLGHAKSTTTLETYSHLWPTAEDKSRAAAATIAAEVFAPAEGTVRAEDA